MADGRASWKIISKRREEQAAISLMLHTEGTHGSIFESSQLEESYVGDTACGEKSKTAVGN